MGSLGIKFRLLIIFLLNFVFFLYGSEDEIVEKILLYDDSYSVQYAGDIETAHYYFRAHGFKVLNAEEVKDWISDKLDNKSAHNTVILHLSDLNPKILVEPWDKSSLLYRYCESGGRWVAPGGVTLYSFLGKKDLSISNQGSDLKDADKFITSTFGIRRVYALRGEGSEITDIGKEWGLGYGNRQWINYFSTGVPKEDVTSLVTSKRGNVSLVWYKNINTNYPYSGLVGLCTNLSSFEPMLDMIYRLCTYNGKAVLNIAKKDWMKKDITHDFEVKFISKQGNIPRKVYQRGEIIPLTLHAYGKKYTGQSVTFSLKLGKQTVMTKTYPATVRKGLLVSERIDTNNLKCGEYILTGSIAGKEINSEKIWISPARRNNAFPFLTCKMYRRNPMREQVALEYLRDQNVNAMIFDLYQLADANTNPKTAKILGNYLDLLLKNNLIASARPTSMQMYTKKAKEKLILADGSVHSHGANHDAMSWRGYIAGHLDEYRKGLRQQVSLLRGSKSPVILPYFTTNDDGSMGGNYDFNTLTMKEFQKQTGLTRKDLPLLKRIKDGNNVFMPIVKQGVIPNNHPWLQYFKYHTGNYSKIARAAMEGIESAWPGSLVGDTGCMSGPLYIPRGYYPPLSFTSYNTATFYQYLFWFNAYHFAIEVARMGNRDKPVGLVISASYIPWGKVFQRGVLYRILAEAPKFIALWSLDARQVKTLDMEKETWEGTKSVATKVANIAEFINLQKVSSRKGALFFGLAQNCFKTTDLNMRPYYMRTALENFTRAGANLDLLSTEEIMKGALIKYKVIFINSHQWITAGVKKSMESYIENGGIVVADSQTSIDIKGAIKVDGPFGRNLNDVGDPDEVERCRKLVNKYLPSPMVEAYSPNTIVRVNKVKKITLLWVIDIESSENIQKLAFEQSNNWAKGVYTYLNKEAKEQPYVNKRISIPNGFYAYDLWNNKELELTVFNQQNIAKLSVERFGGTPVALYRDKITSLNSEVSSVTLNCGDVYIKFFELLSNKNTPVRGIVPAQVTVYAPDGEEVWEYGGNKLINDGSLEVKINTADNDLIGIWKVKVKELCSGKTSESQFELKKNLN